MDFISYLKTLKPNDWNKKANSKWTIKDVVAHMVGWEKEGVKVLREFMEQGKGNLWFLHTGNYDEFNAKSVKYYQNYTVEKLIAEWEKYMYEIEDLIKQIGEKKLRSREDMRWLFEKDTPEGHEGHYNYHFKQIKKAIKKKQ